MANKKAIGNLGEDIALKYLEELGFSLLERNFKGKKTRGEIDLVMTKGVVIVFIEVKYRRQGSFGYAAYSISERKKRKLYETAEEYLIEKGLSFNQKCSFGAVLIDDTHYKREISFIEDIFI
ncbi:YraN family protein [uncultured Brachyspira sp.]|uniref:YraN family protein n=1 Tax=uncultured Brachyspira sp. TaxID=221953 RepID=UPI002630CC4C|nr:YraN family protein [uncultured Brachyspira sp.]